jgi:uncharacterized protein YlxW (UPF0749 family)
VTSDDTPKTTQPDGEAPEDPPNAPPPPGKDAQQERRRRPSIRSKIAVAALCALLGVALVAQTRSQSDSGLTGARQGDLVQILDDLTAREERLNKEISDLEKTRDDLNSGTAGTKAALDEAERRSRELGVLAGTEPATGPGLVVRISEGDDPLGADVLLDAVQELRGAGAEAMQIAGGGHTVRVGASTYFADSGSGSAAAVSVDGTKLASPYTITVVGDPQTMDVALRISGGVVDTVRRGGGKVSIEQRDTVKVSTLRELTTPKYAKPAS